MALGFGTVPVTAAGTAASTSPSTPKQSQVTAAPKVPRNVQYLGVMPAGASIAGAVVLQPRDNAAVTTFIHDVTNKKSKNYHQYLTPSQFGTKFGASQSTINAVTSHLRAHGLRVTVSTDGLMVNFSGPAASVENAFGTGLASYKLADGTMGHATTGAVNLPSTFAGSVASVVGLNDLVHASHGALRPPPSAKGTITAPKTAPFPHTNPGAPSACFDAAITAQEFGGLTDDQIANAYGATNLYNSGVLGAGQHIAIYELEPFLLSDLQAFDDCYYGSAAESTMTTSLLHVIPVDGGQPAGAGSAEAALDVEDVSGIAPQANIDVYEAPNTSFGNLDEYSQIVNTNVDTIVSSSWGLCEQAVQLAEPGVQQAENLIFEQAATQGQTVLNSAGDTGSDSCNAFRNVFPPSDQNVLSVSDPASQPYVLAVGGTTLDDAIPGQLSEHVWNDGAEWGAGGGGISQSWTQPSWQSALVSQVAAANASSVSQAQGVESATGQPTGFCGALATIGCRELPDVSAQADEFTGAVTIYFTPIGWLTIGGTSSSTPIWAGLLALVNNNCALGSFGLSNVGFVPPLLYSVASVPFTYAASFNDTTTGNNDNYGLDNGLVFAAGTGYDMGAGLGTPMLTAPGGGAGLAAYMCIFAAVGFSNSPPTVTSLDPISGSTAGGYSLTIHGSNFTITGTPNVRSIQIGSRQILSGFTVANDNTIYVTVPPAASTLPPGSTAPLDGAGPAPVTVTINNGGGGDILSSALTPAAVFQYVDGTSTGFTQRPGAAVDVAVGGGQVYVLGTNSAPGGFAIYHWTGSGWVPVPGGGTSIAVDSAGHPWVTNNANGIWAWNGSYWTGIPGSAKYVAAGNDGSVEVLGTNAVPGGWGIWKWNSGTHSWSAISGGLTDLAIGADGANWGVNNANNTYRRTSGGGWSQVAGSANDVTAMDYNHAWSVSTAAAAGGFTLAAFTGTGWAQEPGGAVDLAVNPATGALWVANSANNIYTSGFSSAVPAVTSVGPYGGNAAAPTAVRIYGANFDSSDKVTFGGVAGTGLTVVSPTQLMVTPPAKSGATACGPSAAGQNTTTDICQVQVQVTNAYGSSALGTILPPYEGMQLPFTSMGATALPSGCGCEEMPAPTEYDYVPTPTITGVSQTGDPHTFASEFGGTLLTITGTGFDPLTFAGVQFKDPTDPTGTFTPFTSFLSGTKLQVVAPCWDPTSFCNNVTSDMATAALSVRSLGGASASGPTVDYAGLPSVSNVINNDFGNRLTDGLLGLTDVPGASDLGGENLTIEGAGFNDAIFVGYQDQFSPFSIGTQYTFNPVSDTVLDTQSVAMNPAIVDTLVCTVTGCGGSFPSAADSLLIYPPGTSDVNGLTTGSGPTFGGTDMFLLGTNLGFAISANFGAANTPLALNLPSLLDSGTTNAVEVLTPPSATPNVNGLVPVSVETAESFYRADTQNSDASFEYQVWPTVTSVSPARGPAVSGNGGNDTVVITGTGFMGGTSIDDCMADAVSFGGLGAAPTTCSDTSITVTEPGGTAGNTVDLRVHNFWAESSVNAPADHYKFIPAPTVTSVTPSSGTASGGTTIAVTGTGFFGGGSSCSDITAVKFVTDVTNNANLATIANCSDTAFTITTPAYTGANTLPTTADILVVTSFGGQSAATSADHYSFT